MTTAPDEDTSTRDGTGDGAPGSTPGPVPARALRLLTAAVAALSVVLLVLAVVLALQWQRARSAQDDREAALSAAEAQGLNLTSLNPDNAEETLADIRDGATGEFLTTFEQEQPGLLAAIASNQVNTQGVLVASAVREIDEDEARVLLTLDVAVTNAASGGEQTSRRFRAEMTMSKQDDRWLTSFFDLDVVADEEPGAGAPAAPTAPGAPTAPSAPAAPVDPAAPTAPTTPAPEPS